MGLTVANKEQHLEVSYLGQRIGYITVLWSVQKEAGRKLVMV